MNSSLLPSPETERGAGFDQVEICLLNPDQILSLADRAPDLLPPDAWNMGALPKDARIRRLWEGRQVALRLLLGEALNLDARRIRIGREGLGKPHLLDFPDRHFSVSSSEGWWLAGITHGPIGVDLEVVRPFPDLQAVAQAYFNRSELAHLDKAPDAVERLRCFYRFWTRKEALLKLKGEGISGLSALRDREVQGVWLEELALQQGLAASLALPKAPGRISMHNWRKDTVPRRRGADGNEAKPQSTWLSDAGKDEAERLRKQDALFLPQELPVILDTMPTAGCFVDFGCGVGSVGDAVAAALPECRVHRYDIDPLAVLKSRENFGDRPNLEFGCRGIDQGPPAGFPGADAAILHLVLMHSPDPTGLLRAVKRWMKPGGILHVVETDDRSLGFEPFREWLPELLDLMELVQRFKGGSRHRGRDLPRLLKEGGWCLLGLKESCLDPGVAVAAVPKVFLPVAEMYLNEASRLGIGGEGTVLRLRARLEELRAGKTFLLKIRVPQYHAWAHAE